MTWGLSIRLQMIVASVDYILDIKMVHKLINIRSIRVNAMFSAFRVGLRQRHRQERVVNVICNQFSSHAFAIYTDLHVGKFPLVYQLVIWWRFHPFPISMSTHLLLSCKFSSVCNCMLPDFKPNWKYVWAKYSESESWMTVLKKIRFDLAN